MSHETTKTIYINVKDLSFKNDEFVEDLMQFLTEQLPQIDIERKGNELELSIPNNLSKRAVRTRIKKFLYKKKLKEEFRPISYKTDEKDGYSVKERKEFEFAYY